METTLNFNPWDELLHRYVDGRGRVDYAAWKAESTLTLQRWLGVLSEVNPRDYPNPDWQLAFWLNLYNALVIAEVLKSYPIPSIRPRIFGVPNWVAFFRFFSRPVFTLDGRRYSLNLIEHGTIRPQFRDPRVHFALVCAASGCPLLRNEAYHPQRIQTQLDEDAEQFINNPDKMRFDAATTTLYCSQIFRWYRRDFLDVAPSLPAYARRYLASGDTLTDAATVRYLDYDWSLNQRISS